MSRSRGSSIGTEAARSAEFLILNHLEFAEHKVAFKRAFLSSTLRLKFLDQPRLEWGWKTGAELILQGRIAEVRRFLDRNLA